MVEQFGLAMTRRGASNASSGLTSGTTRGTSASMRNALELSIISVPCFVMVFSNSLEVPPPADTNATSTPLKSSLWRSLLHLHPLAAELIKTARAAPPNRTTATHPPGNSCLPIPSGTPALRRRSRRQSLLSFSIMLQFLLSRPSYAPTLRRLRHPFAGLPGRAAQNGDIRPTPHQSKNSSSPE